MNYDWMQCYNTTPKILGMINMKPFMIRYESIGVITRPNADDGLWLSALLTVCFTMNIWTLNEVGSSYKRSAIVCFGMFIHSTYTFMSHNRSTQKLICTVFNIAFICSLLHIYLSDNIYLSIASGLSTIIMYDYVYFGVLKRMPRCFTLGEATIVCQGLVIFLYQAFLNVPRIFISEKITSEASTMNLVLQIIVLSSSLIFITCHFQILRGTILMCSSIVIVTGTIIFPINGQSLCIILLKFLFNDPKRITAIALYMFLLLVTGVFAIWQMNRSTVVNTTTRKTFHILILTVYLHGLLYQCTLLYVASVLMLVLLLMLETARVIRLQPIYNALEGVVTCFIDEKDTGSIVLTPIYLLVGCSLPMWLHPVVCDLTDSSGFHLMKLLAGVLSVGIGDTMASLCGYHFGKHKWPGSLKSVEGTLASIVAQTGVVFALFKSGLIHLNNVRAANAGIAIITNALVEARTNQVDNLVLPLITYVILCAV